MKGSAPDYPRIATDENTPKHPHTDIEHTHMDTKDTHTSTRENISNSTYIDIKESATLLLLASLMNSPATLAHKYVIRQALTPKTPDY